MEWRCWITQSDGGEKMRRFGKANSFFIVLMALLVALHRVWILMYLVSCFGLLGSVLRYSKAHENNSS